MEAWESILKATVFLNIRDESGNLVHLESSLSSALGFGHAPPVLSHRSHGQGQLSFVTEAVFRSG